MRHGHANAKRKQEPMHSFMAKNEDYRKHIDQKKGKQKAFLLSQTDKYISNLTEMVKQHKMKQKSKQVGEQKRKKKKKRLQNGEEGANCDVCMSDIEIAKGKTLADEDTLLMMSQLSSFL